MSTSLSTNIVGSVSTSSSGNPRMYNVPDVPNPSPESSKIAVFKVEEGSPSSGPTSTLPAHTPKQRLHSQGWPLLRLLWPPPRFRFSDNPILSPSARTRELAIALATEALFAFLTFLILITTYNYRYGNQCRSSK